jgi:hypothetical protein
MKKLKTLYGLPQKIIFCKKTLMSNQRPSSEQEFTHSIKSKKKQFFLIKMEFAMLGNILEKKNK